ncbi:hypothetical protein V2J09_009538 [Rumex salicifolius]
MAAGQSENKGASGSGQPPEGQNGNNKNGSKSFSKKCGRAVKKQRAKLYIIEAHESWKMYGRCHFKIKPQMEDIF